MVMCIFGFVFCLVEDNELDDCVVFVLENNFNFFGVVVIFDFICFDVFVVVVKC